jgi:hypothetical protein
VTADQLLRAIESLGDRADEDFLTTLVNDPVRRAGIVDCLNSMERSGLVEVEHRRRFKLTRAGTLRLTTRAGRVA